MAALQSESRRTTLQTAYRLRVGVGSVWSSMGKYIYAGNLTRKVPHQRQLRTVVLAIMGASSSTAVAPESNESEDEMVLNGTCVFLR